MLHLSDDAAELRQVASQHVVAVHPPQVVGDRVRVVEDGHKGRDVLRVASKRGVDQAAGAPQLPQRPSAQAARLRVAGQLKEGAQDVGRPALEYVVGGDVEQTVAHHKVVVHRQRPADVHAGERCVKGAQQDGVEQVDGLCGAVVALHQPLGRAFAATIEQAELARQRCLPVEQQAVLPALGQPVQANAEVLQKALMTADERGFGGGEQACACQRRPA